MANIKVGIVEDELLIAHGIATALKNMGYDVAEPAISYTEALGMIVSEQPDIVLVDIHLKGHKDGIDLARKIREQFNIPFMFLTANADIATVTRAKEAAPHAYLVKPFKQAELYAAIEVCLHNFSGRHGTEPSTAQETHVVKDSLFIKQGQKYHKVHLADITHIESKDVYIYVYATSAQSLVRSSMQGFLDQVPAARFLRVHKSYLINTTHITTVSAETLNIGSIEIPIGRSYRDEVIAFLDLK